MEPITNKKVIIEPINIDILFSYEPKICFYTFISMCSFWVQIFIHYIVCLRANGE